jgi:RNA polymerase sigma-70 factor (ECF subfamily)
MVLQFQRAWECGGSPLYTKRLPGIFQKPQSFFRRLTDPVVSEARHRLGCIIFDHLPKEFENRPAFERFGRFGLCTAQQAMTATAAKAHQESLPTRWSLLTRLKNWDDQESWRVFFDAYWRLIYNVAIKAGLSDPEAQDVVQETVITVAKNLKDFKTDPKRGSFKAWLLKTTRWRIINQFNKRRPDQVARSHRAAEDTRETATVDRIADSGEAHLNIVWDTEWKEHVIAVALEELKHKVKPKHFQIFFLHVIKRQSVKDVAKSLGVNVAQVYLVKHRLTHEFRKNVTRLEKELG